MILEIVAIQEEVIQEKIKVWGRKLPHLFLLHIRSCKCNPITLLAFLLNSPQVQGLSPVEHAKKCWHFYSMPLRCCRFAGLQLGFDSIANAMTAGC
jgi:hypothetical protein